jgi:protein tyrosine/serine phosphatase
MTPNPLASKRARSELMWRDHGFLRILFQNFHRLSPDLARCNQPSPEQLARYAAMGFRTVINLRGASDRGHYLLEREACSELSLHLIDFPTTSNAAPEREMILAARDLFATIRSPALMHCKSGSDRTGLMGVLYRHLVEGAPVAVALEQLAPRYLHVRHGKAGIIDAFFEAYLNDTRDESKSFLDWVIEDYDPIALQAAYKRGVWAKGLIDLLLDWTHDLPEAPKVRPLSQV